nr:PREDICTED: uncharacterized protein LOC108203408 [Daucus carota subsp. sativus]
MAFINAIGCSEGLSNSRPPLFDGTNFATWKTRFRIYARSQGVKVWMAIEDGTILPTKIVDDIIIEKKGKINQSPNGYNNANNNGTYTPPKPKEQNPEETPNVCFECKQPGHFKRECPKLSKGRILVAENGWDLSEDEETSEATEEVVNLCLMALEDDSSSSDISTSNDEVSSRTKLLHNMHLFNDSSLNLLDMSKSDLIDLLVEMNERNNSVNQHTLSRISELNLKHEEEVSSLCEQNDFLKNENNKYKDVVTKLEIENISLVLNTEELENEKLQLNENTRMLHVDLLNLKIQNESLAQGKSNSVVQKDNDELVHALSEKDEIFELETQRLKDEHSKILAQVMDQERILNDKINILSKEKDDLARTIQKFTKGNELLDKMVCLVTKRDMWYLDSGCSRHMTGNKSLLKSIRKVTAGSVTFGDSSKGSIIGIGDIGNEHFKIANVQLVTGLKYNLLSISQLCDNGYKVIFYPTHCSILNKDGKLMLTCPRSKNVYTCDIRSHRIWNSGSGSSIGYSNQSADMDEGWLDL